MRPWLYPQMADRVVAAHRRAGHVVALLTSATRYLAEPLAAELGIEHLLVTQLVVRDGRFTGEAVRPICYGAGKIHWASASPPTRRWTRSAASYFYTDSVTDLPVLERVGHPRIVIPTRGSAVWRSVGDGRCCGPRLGGRDRSRWRHREADIAETPRGHAEQGEGSG